MSKTRNTEHQTQLLTGIPKCKRKCSDCGDALHHWIELTLDPDRVDDDDPDKDRADEIIADWLRWTAEDPRGAPICPMVWVCKHCDFWMRYIETCDVCEGPADMVGKCLSHNEHHARPTIEEAEEAEENY